MQLLCLYYYVFKSKCNKYIIFFVIKYAQGRPQKKKRVKKRRESNPTLNYQDSAQSYIQIKSHLS